MDTFSVGEVITIPCSIMYLENQVTLCIPYFVVSELYEHIFECQLLIIIGSVHIGFPIHVAVIQTIAFIVAERSFGYRISR